MFRYTITLLVLAILASGSALPPKLKKHHPGRIIGGTEVPIEDNPWQVSLQVSGVHACGGSIISENTILTAAHCIDGSIYEVLSGTSMDIAINTTVSSIKQTIAHPDYHDSSNDIAVVILNEPLVFGDTTQAVPLADEDPDVGATVRVTGWGVVNTSDIFAPNWILYGVDVAIVGREECSADYADVAAVTVDESTVCAGVAEGGKDACWGDSGGPLTKDGVLVGIVSSGYGCALAGYPGVYASVASMRQWIKDNSGI